MLLTPVWNFLEHYEIVRRMHLEAGKLAPNSVLLIISDTTLGKWLLWISVTASVKWTNHRTLGLERTLEFHCGLLMGKLGPKDVNDLPSVTERVLRDNLGFLSPGPGLCVSLPRCHMISLLYKTVAGIKWDCNVLENYQMWSVITFTKIWGCGGESGWRQKNLTHLMAL